MMTTRRQRWQAVPNKDMKPFPILAKWIKMCVLSSMLTALATRRLPTHTRKIAEPYSIRNTHSNSAHYMTYIWLAYSLCSVKVLSMALLDTISLTIVGHTDAIDWRVSDNLHRLGRLPMCTCFGWNSRLTPTHTAIHRQTRIRCDRTDVFNSNRLQQWNESLYTGLSLGWIITCHVTRVDFRSSYEMHNEQCTSRC